MENKVIAKEYVDKNYVEKSILKKAMREGMMKAKGFEEKAGADIMKKYILVAMGELDKKALDLYETNNRINDLLDIVKQKDEAIKILLTAFEKEKEKNKRAEELYMQHNQMIIDILKECDYMIKNRYYMNDIAIRQYAEKIKDIAKYYIKEPEWIEIEEE